MMSMSARRASAACWLCILAISLTMSGCATVYNPATGQQETILRVISDQDEYRLGQRYYLNVVNQHGAQAVYEDARVDRVAERVFAVADHRRYPYHILVVDDGQINASTVGGYVFLNRDLVDLLDDDELASVMAHELAHNASYHLAKAAQGQAVFGLMLAALNRPGRESAQKTAATIFQVLSNGYSQQHEIEADGLGVRYVHDAGYDPQGAIRALEKIQAANPQRLVPFLHTHPPFPQRIDSLRDAIRRLQQPATHTRVPVLEAAPSVRHMVESTPYEAQFIGQCLVCDTVHDLTQHTAPTFQCPVCGNSMRRESMLGKYRKTRQP